MIARGSQSLTWDAESRVATVSGGASFVYDGDGARVKKTENGETVLYVNQYYEKNLTTGVVTTSYYLGDKLIAQKEGTALRYVHQDSLSGTSVMTTDQGTLVSYIKYYPYGATRSGSVPTDRKFTGQRLDGIGLYYYGARYYDPGIGRFISADPIVQSLMNPQALNRYSYVWGNPLRYTDPSGLCVKFQGYPGCYQEPDWSLMQDDAWLPPDEMLAWELMRMSSPEAADLAASLESSEEVTSISWSNQTDVKELRGVTYITLAGDLKTDVGDAARTLGEKAQRVANGSTPKGYDWGFLGEQRPTQEADWGRLFAGGALFVSSAFVTITGAVVVGIGFAEPAVIGPLGVVTGLHTIAIGGMMVSAGWIGMGVGSGMVWQAFSVGKR